MRELCWSRLVLTLLLIDNATTHATNFNQKNTHRPDDPAVGHFPLRRQLLPGEKRRLQVAPLYGSINDYAYYFVDVLVGSPPQRQSVILDSGSSLLGFPCTSCGRACGRHLDPAFDLQKSSTAELYSCSDRRCFSRDNCASSEPNTCRYAQIYSEGSSIEGFFFSDRIAVGGEAEGNDFVTYDYIGCHTRETVLFTTQQANGILGVSFPKGGRQPTVMDVLMGSPVVNSKVFSLCAAEHGGTLTVGGYNASYHKPSLSVAGNAQSYGWLSHLLRGSQPRAFNVDRAIQPTKEVVWARIGSDNSYSISVARLHLGTKLVVNGGFGEVLVDSGTTYTYFPNEVYNKIATELTDICSRNNLLPELKAAGTCVKGKSDLVCFYFKGPLPIAQYIKRIPSFSLELSNGGVIEWGPESWLFQKSERVWCSAVENNRRSQTILGMSFMKMKEVIFDRDNSFIGFVSADCPTHHVKDRPDISTGVSQFPNFDAEAAKQDVGIEAVKMSPILDADKNVTASWEWKSESDLPYLTSMNNDPAYESLGYEHFPPGAWMMAGGLGVTVVGGLVTMVLRSARVDGVFEESRQECDPLTQQQPSPQ